MLVVATACRYGFDAAGTDATTEPPGDAVFVDDAMPAANANIAFITSTSVASDFGGISGADAICAAHATAAGLTGTYIALLGDSTQDPLARLAGSRGWVDTTGEIIVDDPSGWMSGAMYRPLDHDETGAAVGYAIVWVGSRPDMTCQDWTVTGTTGSSVVATKTVFGGYTVYNCANPAPLVCVGIGRNVALTPPKMSGRRTFVTLNPWTPGGGRASADALCASEASANGLTGTFLALLATPTETAWERFSTQGPTWVRLDGVALAPTAAEVVATEPPEYATFPIIKADGSVYPYVPKWAGSQTSHCNDWGSTAAQGRTAAGENIIKDWYLGLYDGPCTQSLALTCVEP